MTICPSKEWQMERTIKCVYMYLVRKWEIYKYAHLLTQTKEISSPWDIDLQTKFIFSYNPMFDIWRGVKPSDMFNLNFSYFTKLQGCNYHTHLDKFYSWLTRAPWPLPENILKSRFQTGKTFTVISIINQFFCNVFDLLNLSLL